MTEPTNLPEPSGVLDPLGTSKAAEAQEAKPAEGKEPEPGPDLVQQLRTELLRKDNALSALTTRGANYEKRLQDLEPYARAGIALANDPQGKVIYDKLERGEKLSAAEEGAAGAAAQAVAAAPNMGPVEIRSIIREELGANKAAEQHTTKMLKTLRAEFDDFDDVMNSGRFWPIVDRTLAMIEDGSMPLDEDGQDAYDCAFRHGYHGTIAATPIIRKARAEAVKVNAKKAAAAVIAAEAVGGSSTGSDVETPQQTEESEGLTKMLKLYKGIEPGGPTGERFSR